MACIGILALQGAFREHQAALRKCGASSVAVRTVQDLAGCDALIIPGGESTTMAKIAESTGLLDALRTFVIEQQRPVWGTCAGLIFLAESAEGAKQGGQALLQCLKVHVSRNFFGAQVESFEARLSAPAALRDLGDADTYRAVFIRAPAILSMDDSVEALSEYQLPDADASRLGRSAVTVAARAGHMLVTAFHPELTDDLRWHQLFVNMATAGMKGGQSAAAVGVAPAAAIKVPNLPADLPVYGATHCSTSQAAA